MEGYSGEVKVSLERANRSGYVLVELSEAERPKDVYWQGVGWEARNEVRFYHIFIT